MSLASLVRVAGGTSSAGNGPSSTAKSTDMLSRLREVPNHWLPRHSNGEFMIPKSVTS